MTSKTFKVGTFNLFNLILPNVPYYENRRYSPEAFAKKKSWIAHQLKGMNADIVGFQEVFQVEALQQALDESGLYRQAKLLAPNRTGESPTVALVSRFPVIDHRVIEVFPANAQLDVEGVVIPFNRFSRAVLSVDLALTEHLKCTVFVVHLKSKRPMIPDDVDRNDPIEKVKGQVRSLIQRAAEATALRVILMEFLQGQAHPVILMGDINDGGLAVTSQIVSGEPPFHKMQFERKTELWDVLLYHVKDIQARRSYGDFYYTHIHNGHYESLDHIMVSQEFVGENPNRVGRVNYVSVFNDHLMDQTLSRDGVELWQSDHGQVVAAIELGR